MYSKIKGLTFREQEAGPLPWGSIKPGDRLTLISDSCGQWSGKQHDDENALAVVHQPTQFFLGYIPKETALILAEKGAEYFRASVTEVTGGVEGRENRGINIHLEYLKEGEFEQRD